MAESLTAARPYAKALYDVASRGDNETWLSLMQICKALGESEESKRFLNAHDLTLDKFNQTIQSVLSAASISQTPKAFDNFVRLLAQNKRFTLLPEIAELFIEESNKSNDTVIAEIITAKPLTDESKDKLLAKLTEKYGKKVEASIVIEKALIGGAIIRVGDTVIDGSIKGRLEQLAKALN
ncbi:MAG: F0F1 ATP synthase subunit delta [Gammaproteobacteria bacterium]|nr:F0F1 ATP synthase subunit delta [Gammaproteobacteria bacterium]